MKKATAIILGTLIASSAALAQTNVLSRNAVGYIKVPVESNKLYLVSNPFVPLDPTGDIVTNMLAAVPNGTTISVWDEGSQGYISYSKSARGAWGANATTSRIARADAFFIKMPAAGTATVFFMGEVPDRFTAPTTTQSRVSGLTMLGFPYPVQTSFTGTPMAISAPNGSVISFWDSATQGYVSYSKSARGAWDAGAQAAVASPGQGFVIKSTAAGNSWSTTKPYTWP
ncbi:MAG TPA: hypothetical protein PKE26_16770 [Kiritimatiellia bacterium]|nr:hypothetical protein [Kiritimatiellia bacterium]HMP00751.1 hypothetical protein [Kiritimatiellia bacterium]